jgi:hypothetical protein
MGWQKLARATVPFEVFFLGLGLKKGLLDEEIEELVIRYRVFVIIIYRAL